jgi:hypothetical protein
MKERHRTGTGHEGMRKTIERHGTFRYKNIRELKQQEKGRNGKGMEI